MRLACVRVAFPQALDNPTQVEVLHLQKQEQVIDEVSGFVDDLFVIAVY